MAEDPIETTAPATSDAERERHRRYLAARRGARAALVLPARADLPGGQRDLAAVNLLSDPGEIWFVFPLIGWGIGLAIHGFTTFGFGGLFGPEWERRKIEQLLAADEKRGRR